MTDMLRVCDPRARDKLSGARGPIRGAGGLALARQSATPSRKSDPAPIHVRETPHWRKTGHRPVKSRFWGPAPKGSGE